MDGHKFFQPHFKPDFNIDLLCTVNYICHLFVVKKEIVDQIGMLKKEFVPVHGHLIFIGIQNLKLRILIQRFHTPEQCGHESGNRRFYRVCRS